jgi:ubiquinone/menaquinone biosynthesis C-methylase UbiE
MLINKLYFLLCATQHWKPAPSTIKVYSPTMSHSTDSHQIKGDIKKAYDDIANVYLDWTQPSHQRRLSYVESMLQYLDPAKQNRQMNILELGCGAGVPCTQLLSSRGHSVTANDISDAQIALARNRLPPSVNLIPGDMMELEFAPEQFDAVLALYSVIHLPRNEQTTMLRHIFQWLKPGGRVLANFTAAEFASSTNQSWLGGSQGAMHWSGWGRDETKRVLLDIGYEIEIDEISEDLEEYNGVSQSIPFHWILAKKC